MPLHRSGQTIPNDSAHNSDNWYDFKGTPVLAPFTITTPGTARHVEVLSPSLSLSLSLSLPTHTITRSSFSSFSLFLLSFFRHFLTHFSGSFDSGA
jgi:hypothetical protein